MSRPSSALGLEPGAAPARLLLVDDEPDVLDIYGLALGKTGYHIETASTGTQAVAILQKQSFDLIISDISMPGIDGLELLRKIREIDLDVPVIIMTAGPTVEAAMKAVELGAMRYLTKPVEPEALRNVVEYGLNLHRIMREKREALKLVTGAQGIPSDLAGMTVVFEKAMKALVPHYQPIVSWSKKSVVAYEVLIRTKEPMLVNPFELFSAAETLKRTQELGRAIRSSVAQAIVETSFSGMFYVNLHPDDLEDAALYSSTEPLSHWSSRVVLEMSERCSFPSVLEARTRITRLRGLGYKIAMDDMGSGNAGLASFAKLEPDIVKLDMGLIRGSDKDPTRQRLIRSLSELCKELKSQVIAEGVETPAERDVVVNAGCDLMQGYLFGRPEKTMRPPVWL